MTRHPGLFVSVVVPLQDDADIVERFVEELGAVLQAHYRHYEIILVDDGSKDATLRTIGMLLPQVPDLRLIPLSRRFGEEIAIAAGLDSAIGDFVVVMLPDADPPTAVPDMVERARSGVGVVFGVRQDREGDPLLHRTGARLFYGLAATCGLPIRRDATHFRVLSREAVNAITRIRSPKRYLRTLSQSIGFGDTGFPYRPRTLRGRRRRRPLRELARLGVDIVVTNTTWPLRAASALALGGAFATGCFALYVVGVYLFKTDVAEGWATTAGPLAAVSTVLMLGLGVMGHYLVRVIDAQADGPLYHTLDERNSTAASPTEAERNVVDRALPDPVGPTT
jgi:glycosyltransferase involved in cell wall biosynthesis